MEYYCVNNVIKDQNQLSLPTNFNNPIKTYFSYSKTPFNFTGAQNQLFIRFGTAFVCKKILKVMNLPHILFHIKPEPKEI